MLKKRGHDQIRQNQTLRQNDIMENLNCTTRISMILDYKEKKAEICICNVQANAM